MRSLFKARSAAGPLPELCAVYAALSKSGYRLTAQREAVIEKFARRRKYVTAKDLHRRLRRSDPPIGLATVYRALDALGHIGAASQSAQRHGETAYLFCAIRHHHHAVCTRCGHVDDVPCRSIAPFQKCLARDFNFRLAHHRLDFFGLCAACS
ncbi:MAG: transcriptional repressor [Candidatus Eremiobacteraeota bacterium]|nr:transcriptional repressor [Candidatus Eremiobacteraeota bacterium]MBC5827034.1 transcriptional repressor [Candidatus Eremiobacteraeota bacterium]